MNKEVNHQENALLLNLYKIKIIMKNALSLYFQKN